MRLKQVILNYQSNALKYSKRGGMVTIVCKMAVEPTMSLEVSVIDTGYGIKEEQIPKLFNLFGYFDSQPQVNKNGVGLGLYITKKIV